MIIKRANIQSIDVDIDEIRVLEEVLLAWVKEHLGYTQINSLDNIELTSDNKWLKVTVDTEEELGEATRGDRITYKGLKFAIDFCEEHYE